MGCIVLVSLGLGGCHTIQQIPPFRWSLDGEAEAGLACVSLGGLAWLYIDTGDISFCCRGGYPRGGRKPDLLEFL